MSSTEMLRDDRLQIDASVVNLVDYARERLGRARQRGLLFVFGAVLASFEIGLLPAWLIFAMMWGSDLLDIAIVRRNLPLLKRDTTLSARKRIERKFLATGILQALCFGVFPVLIYEAMSDGQATLMIVVAGLTMGAVQTGLTLPYFPLVAKIRLGIYLCAAVSAGLYRVVNQDFMSGIDKSLGASIIVVACSVYCVVTFIKSGVISHRFNMELLASQKEERSTKAQLERLSSIAEKANDCIIMYGRDGKIQWVNDAFCTVTGYSKAAAIGSCAKDLHERIPLDIELSGEESPYRNPEDTFKGDAQRMTRSGKPIWMSVNKFPVFDENSELRYMVSIERDITQSKQREADLAAAKTQAEEAGRVKAEFLANMSHEIRTPLNGVVGMSEILAETDLGPEQSAYVDTIRDSSESLLGLINDILDLSKLDAGKVKICHETFETKQFFENISRVFTPQIREKGLDLTLSVSPDVPEQIVTDKGRVRQVLTNIIGNAVKFTETGGVFVDVGVTMSGRKLNLIVKVRDTGVGISADKLDMVFEKFTQAENSTSRRFGGTGLGLSISRHLVELLGGQISIQSSLGKGSCFTIEIPVEHALPDIGGSARHEARNCDVSILQGMTVLIAEDNKTNMFIARSFLQDLPVDIIEAQDGVEAVEMTIAHSPDLIFMDMSMPRMTGLEACCEIRSCDIKQPVIIALTANVMNEQRDQCREAGMDGFLSKPIKKQELIDGLISICTKTDFARGLRRSA